MHFDYILLYFSLKKHQNTSYGTDLISVFCYLDYPLKAISSSKRSGSDLPWLPNKVEALLSWKVYRKLVHHKKWVGLSRIQSKPGLSTLFIGQVSLP